MLHFNPAETDEPAGYADGLRGWGERLPADHRAGTGWPPAHEWQEANAPLVPGRRPLPETPFVLGGAFAADNRRDADAVEGTRCRARVARRIRDLPDGARARTEFT